MQKPLQLSFKNVEGSDAMRSIVQDRVSRLDRVFPNLIGCRVVIEVPHRPARGGAVPLGISVEVEIPGKPMLVVKDTEERRHAQDHAVMVNGSFDVVERKRRRMRPSARPARSHACSRSRITASSRRRRPDRSISRATPSSTDASTS
jgi:ribosome-associated translation inhibitor RaiA